MRKIIFFALLALIPLYAISGEDRYDNVYGLWEDYCSGVSLKIKPTKRRGILVKRLDRSRHSHWVRYDRVGRDNYRDYNGNKIRLTHRGLKWSKGYGYQSFYLKKVDYSATHYDYYDRDRGYRDYDYNPRRNYLTSDNLGGNWYCNAHDVSIEVGYLKDGIRVRRQGRGNSNEWYEYHKKDRNNRKYYGDSDKFYEQDGRDLIFYDKRNKKKMVFRRR